MKCSFCHNTCEKLSENHKKSLGFELREDCWLYSCVRCAKQSKLNWVLFFVQKENFLVSWFKTPIIKDIYFSFIQFELREFQIHFPRPPFVNSYQSKTAFEIPAKKFHYSKNDKLFYFYRIKNDASMYEITNREINNSNFSPQDFREKIDMFLLLQ